MRDIKNKLAERFHAAQAARLKGAVRHQPFFMTEAPA